MSWIEIVAVGLGVACVALTVRQNMWCWPTGLVQVLLYIDIFYAARLYSDMLLQVVYVVLQVYGWYHWLADKGEPGNRLPVSRLTAKALCVWMAGTLLGAIAWGQLMYRYTNAAAPYADAFVAAASLSAQYLLARKKLESWFFWIAVDTVAIAVYWTRDLKLTSGLYAVFLTLCVGGVLEWRKSQRTPQPHMALREPA